MLSCTSYNKLIKGKSPVSKNLDNPKNGLTLER